MDSGDKGRLLKVISKILRHFFEKKPVCLNFENLFLGESFTNLIPGLKTNSIVQELNLSKTGITDASLK